MKKFEFRLEKVLAYRRTLESDAKEQYLAAKRETLSMLRSIDDLGTVRKSKLESQCETIHDRVLLAQTLETIDDDERAKRTALSVLLDEEAGKMGHWLTRQQDVKALEKLREQALAEWKHLADREEQAFLDEWSNSRRLL